MFVNKHLFKVFKKGKKMKKRFLALGMAAVTAMSSVVTTPLTALAVDTRDKISGDLTVTGFFNEKTDAVELKSGDSYIFKFHNKSNGTTNYENYVMAVTGTIGADYVNGEQEVLIIRADNWGWGGGMSDFLAPDAINEGNKLIFETNVNWEAWLPATQAGIDCEVTISRDGDTLSYNGKMGDYFFKTTATSGKKLPESCYVFFTGQNCDLTGFTTEKHTVKVPDSEETPTDPEQTPTDPEQTPTDPEQTPTDPEQTPTDPEQTPTDPEQTPTDVVVSEDGSIKVEYGEDQFEGEVKLATKLLGEEDEDYKKINLKNFVKDTANIPEDIPFVAYNISLLDMKDQIIQPNGKVSVKIACPEGYDDGLSKVYRVNSNGSLTNMLAVLKDGYLTFETNHFSTYVVTKEDLFAGSGFVYGDVNGDGEVDVKDAVLLKKYLAEFEDAINSLDKSAGDVTGDGDITSADAVRLLKALAEYKVELGR